MSANHDTGPTWGRAIVVAARTWSRRDIASRTVAALVFGAFFSYYGLLCFRGDWGGDFQAYAALVSRLYDNLLHPAHEAMNVSGKQSALYSFFVVAVGGIGKLCGATPYRALQVAGLVNMIAFGGAMFFFSARQSIHRHYGAAAACLLFATLFLRWRHFGWSSDTSLTSFQYVQAYPSTFAWALAFVLLGWAGHMIGEGDDRELLAFTAVLAVLFLSHMLTASWVIGIVALQGVYASIRDRSWVPIGRTAAAVSIALLAASRWPYAPFWRQQSLTKLEEGSAFGNSPFVDFPSLYALALPCWMYLYFRFKKHGMWMLGAAATLLALWVWHLLDISFGNRYAFFAAFFAQFAVADVMALGIFALLGPLTELEPTRRLPWLDRPFSVLVLVTASLVWLPSPMLATARRVDELGSLRSPRALLEEPSPHDEYYRRFGALGSRLSRADLVLTPVSRSVFDLASITGASVVLSPHAVRVPDVLLRTADIERFFDDSTTPEVRSAIVHHYRVTKVLLPQEQFQLVGALTDLFGEPTYRDDARAMWDVQANGQGRLP